MSFFKIIIKDIFILIFWYEIWLIICHKIYKFFPKYFDYNKIFYKSKKWEKNGNFYIDFLKIKYWKDKLPQNMSKKGFLKNSLRKTSEITSEYLEKFITETCIAEWYHLICAGFSILLFIIDTSTFGIFLGSLNLVAQTSYIAIQRYNRIRLTRVFYKKVSCT